MCWGRLRYCWQSWRNFIAFWCFGLFNNFIYVVMLSAAVDILDRNTPRYSAGQRPNRSPLNCTEMGTGAVLLADIGPSLLLKILAPLFIRRIHYHFKVCLSVFLALSAFLTVSFSKSVAFSLFGVVCASLSCGLGDVTFLTMVAFFDTSVVSSWSSGTGAAGVVGSTFYAGMTSLVPPQTTLLATLFAPLVMLTTYFVILEKPQIAVFQATCGDISSCCRRETQYTRLLEPLTYSNETAAESTTATSDSDLVAADLEGSDLPGQQSELFVQVSPSWEVKKRIIKPLAHHVGGQ
uniref:Battenin n=1 Tax=Mesocestoides corti TaxID=53468 RepID=A0A5K3FEQ9_MESCO